jgi:virginiamycin A acetyltransferase
MKWIVRTIADVVAFVLVAPCWIWFLVKCCIVGGDRAIESCSQTLSLIPGDIGNRIRSVFYRLTLSQFDRTAQVCFGALLSSRSARIGPHVYIGPYCCIGMVSIGADTLIAPHVQIPSGARTHATDRPGVLIRLQGSRSQQVTIGSDCWIGAGSVVMADVGDGTIVAAGSVVTKPLPPGIVAAGVPAQFKKHRNAAGVSVEPRV